MAHRELYEQLTREEVMLPRQPTVGTVEKGGSGSMLGGGGGLHHGRRRVSGEGVKHILTSPQNAIMAPPMADLITEFDIDEDDEIKKVFAGVFHITTTASEPDYNEPWATFASTKSTGTGFAIDRNRRWIMTNHHVIADATLIQVHKNEDFRMYRARVLCSDDVTDLALITVNDDAFWEDVFVIEFQQTEDYKLNTPVTVVGHPLGDKNVSLTQGVISKYMCIPYSQQATILMPAIHVSAAINGGNSGGPVLDGRSLKCLGVAFAAYSSSEDVQNVGLVIPTLLVKRFVKDFVTHGMFTGYFHAGFNYQTLESPTLRTALAVPQGVSGVLVTEVFPPVCEGLFKLNDVVLSLDGHAIGDDATIKFRRGERQSFELLLCTKSRGDKLTFTVLREGKEETVTFSLHTSPTRLIPFKPRMDYFIIGGLAFVPLSQQVDFPTSMGSQASEAKLTCSDEQLVILVEIIAHEVNCGYQLPEGSDGSGQSFESPVRLKSFNGTAVRNIPHLISLVEATRRGGSRVPVPFLKFEFEDPQLKFIILEASEAWKATQEILLQNNISSAKPRRPPAPRPPNDHKTSNNDTHTKPPSSSGGGVVSDAPAASKAKRSRRRRGGKGEAPGPSLNGTAEGEAEGEGEGAERKGRRRHNRRDDTTTQEGGGGEGEACLSDKDKGAHHHHTAPAQAHAQASTHKDSDKDKDTQDKQPSHTATAIATEPSAPVAVAVAASSSPSLRVKSPTLTHSP